jgi:hypothetical protein
VEGLAIDYANNQLVVLGRTKGNSINNFWKGNELTLKAGGNGAQNQLTGTFESANALNYGWLGKYSLSAGKILHSTYIGELNSSQTFSSASSNPNYEGFPDLNSSNFQLGNTYINKLEVNPTTGEIVIAGIADRTITTKNAYQKMLKPLPYQIGGGISTNNSFVRVYNSGLDSIRYSSLVTGLWNPVNGSSDNTRINGVWPLSNGLFFTGHHFGTGGEVITSNVPAWGSDTLENTTALFGLLNYNPALAPPAQPDTIVRPVDFCSGNSFQFSIPPVPGATSYKWVISANGWTGSSTTNTITLNRAAVAIIGQLTVYAINATGVSLARVTILPGTANVNGPTGFTAGQTICANQTQNFQVNAVNGALSYNWSIVGVGCDASWTLGNTTTTSNLVSVSTGATIASPCSLQVIANGCTNSSNPVLFPLPTSGAVPNAPVFASASESPCFGIPKTYSLNPDAGVVSYGHKT